MIQPIEFTISGVPKPAGSKRAFALQKNGKYTGRVVVTDSNKNAKDWKADVKAEAMKHAPEKLIEGPLRLTVTFFSVRPKNHYGSGKNATTLKSDAPLAPIVKPDCTKLIRGLEDALTGLIWKDDSQVTSQHIYKRYADKPGAEVRIVEDQPLSL